MRNTVPEESVNLNNHEHYHKEVYNPCMDYICKVINGFYNDKKYKFHMNSNQLVGIIVILLCWMI